MTSTVVTKEFTGRADGETVTRTFKVGETINGRLAEVAIANKWAEPEKAAKAAKPSEK